MELHQAFRATLWRRGLRLPLCLIAAPSALSARTRRSGLLLSAVIAACIPATSAHAQDSATALQKRVDALESQLVDLQVVMGTIESLGGTAGAATAPPAGAGFQGGQTGFGTGGGSVEGRLDSMEMQIRALSSQMEQLAREVRQLNGDRRGSLRTQPGARSAGYGNYGSTGSTGGRDGASGFGTVTVSPSGEQNSGGYSAQSDPIGGLLSGDGGAVQGWNSSGSGGQQVARAPLDGGDPKEAYETAYGYLLQQNYEAAEQAFRSFLGRYPKDTLASNAQYWLGETHFVRGSYRDAASEFLKGYESYNSGTKAADSLLKLAMSLQRLGQADAACSSLAELAARFPNAPGHVTRRAATERRNAGC